MSKKLAIPSGMIETIQSESEPLHILTKAIHWIHKNPPTFTDEQLKKMFIELYGNELLEYVDYPLIRKWADMLFREVYVISNLEAPKG